LPRSPVTWSVVVTTQRPHGLATRNGTVPMRMRRQRSSAQGGAPVITTLGRNRVIGTGSSPSSVSQRPSSSSEPVLVSSSGNPSAKLTVSPGRP
jgi:hypothetical protein